MTADVVTAMAAAQTQLALYLAQDRAGWADTPAEQAAHIMRVIVWPVLTAAAERQVTA